MKNTKEFAIVSIHFSFQVLSALLAVIVFTYFVLGLVLPEYRIMTVYAGEVIALAAFFMFCNFAKVQMPGSLKIIERSMKKIGIFVSAMSLSFLLVTLLHTYIWKVYDFVPGFDPMFWIQILSQYFLPFCFVIAVFSFGFMLFASRVRMSEDGELQDISRVRKDMVLLIISLYAIFFGILKISSIENTLFQSYLNGALTFIFGGSLFIENFIFLFPLTKGLLQNKNI